MISLDFLRKISLFAVIGFFGSLPTIAHADDLGFSWVNQIGASVTDLSNIVRVAPSGNVYATGYFNGTVDFDAGAGVTNLTSVSTKDYFLTKLDASGNLIWVKDIIAATGSKDTYSMWIDSSDNIYLSGFFQGTIDFDPGAGVTNLVSAGGNEGFVSKFDSSGNLLWAKKIGSTSNDFASSVTVDSLGGVYVTGGFQLTVDFDPGAGVTNATSAGSIDVYILKLDSSGNFVFVQTLGSTGDDRGQSLLLDSSGNISLIGYFNGTVDFDPGAGTTNLTSAGGKDTFITKFDSSGNLLWAKSMGGSSDDYAQSLILDSSDNFYIKGEFAGTVDFDPGVSTYNLTSTNAADIFITKLDSSGNLIWAKNIAGSMYNFYWGKPLALDSFGSLYVAGAYSGTVDFDPGVGVSTLTGGSGTAFILKLDSAGNFLLVKGGITQDGIYGISLDSSNNVYIAGYFTGTKDFDPTSAVYNLSSVSGSFDGFISKLRFLDTTLPIITLNGSSSVTFFVGDSYADAGATATDAVDGNLTGSIITSNNVNVAVPGVYTVSYSVSDAANNSASVSRLVTVYRHNTTRPLNLQINTGSQIPIIVTPPSSSNVTKFVFTKNLKLGMRDPEVLELQKYLNSHGFPISLSGIASLGKETNYFGLATKSALIKFQKANNINPAVGFFGAMTRGYFNNKI